MERARDLWRPRQVPVELTTIACRDPRATVRLDTPQMPVPTKLSPTSPATRPLRREAYFERNTSNVCGSTIRPPGMVATSSPSLSTRPAFVDARHRLDRQPHARSSLRHKRVCSFHSRCNHRFRDTRQHGVGGLHEGTPFPLPPTRPASSADPLQSRPGRVSRSGPDQANRTGAVRRCAQCPSRGSQPYVSK